MTDFVRRRVATYLTLVSLIVLLAIGAALGGCAVGPNYVKPDTHAAAGFEGARDGTFAAADVQGKFWTQFGDDTLTRLEDEALAANYDLRIALAALGEARALRRESLFDLAPTVTANGSYTKERLPPVQSPTGEVFEGQFYEAGFDAFWELDFFGRVRRHIEARTAQAQGAEASLRDAQVSVTAEVARSYFELRGEQLRLKVAHANVDNQRATLTLTESRLDAGRGTQLDTARAASQLSSTLATIGPLEAAVARSIHRLSVLSGREPNALNGLLAPPAELPELPRITAVGDPAGLLRRRPDIRIAERQLAASTAEIGVAVADFFPKVTFTGSLGYAAPTGGALARADNQSYVIAPAISWAAFDLGRVAATVAGRRAEALQALGVYQQTVLRALEETEDALVTHARNRDSLKDATDAAQASLTAAHLARARYEGGMVDFLDVLDAERTELQAEDRLAQSRTDTATSLIAVYKALGGGWELAPPPRELQRSGS